MQREKFNALSFLIRWVIALVLVFVTFNPTPYSYFRWIVQWDASYLPFKLLAGVVLAIVYVIYIRATWRSIGRIGVALATVFFAAIIWALVDFGLLDLFQPTIMTYVLLFIFATILAIGISWSHIRRRISGQADIDQVEH